MTFPTQLVILGAGGFIGQALYRLANSRNVRTLCISRSFQWSGDSSSDSSFISKFVESEVSNVNAYENFIDPYATIVYMAGSTDLVASEADPVSDFKVHSASLLAFLDIVQNTQKFLFISSAGTIYGEPIDLKSKETHNLNPKSIYGCRNKILEGIVSSVGASLNLNYLILRVSNPFGLEQSHLRRKGLILSLLGSHSAEAPVIVRGSGYQRRDYILVNDLCQLLLEISSLSLPIPFNILNVASGVSYSARDVVSIINACTGVNPKVEYVSEDTPSDIQESCLDVSLLREFLDSIGKANLFKDLSHTILLIL